MQHVTVQRVRSRVVSTTKKVLFVAIIFTNKYGPLWWEKNYLQISNKMVPTIQWQLQLEHVSSLSATYRKLVHSIAERSYGPTFVWHATRNTNTSHVLAPVYPCILIDYIS